MIRWEDIVLVAVFSAWMLCLVALVKPRAAEPAPLPPVGHVPLSPGFWGELLQRIDAEARP